ncbi:unnamed protein product [Heligmosomoides polygyrus]|uniref:Transposase n=1 Tax=Heligmosomoides polygyrus TaxID=6339 RepID=A0A183FUC8_HELPZ|nr:unnamed protein product [Heligmosomoides polygyrus]
METKMLRQTAGVTRLDRVLSDTMRQRFGTTAEKKRESRLRWYGHFLRANHNTVRKIGLNLEVPGKQLRGRTKQRFHAANLASSAPLALGAPTLAVRARLILIAWAGALERLGNDEPSVAASVVEPVQLP